MAIKIPVIVTTIRAENYDEIKLYLRNGDRSTWWHSTLEQRTPKNQSDCLYGYGVLLNNVQCHRYLYPYHDIENAGTYNWKHTWNHTVSNHPIHQHGHDMISTVNISCLEHGRCYWYWFIFTGLILGLRLANKRRLLFNDAPHWLGTSLEKVLVSHCLIWFSQRCFRVHSMGFALSTKRTELT